MAKGEYYYLSIQSRQPSDFIGASTLPARLRLEEPYSQDSAEKCWPQGGEPQTRMLTLTFGDLQIAQSYRCTGIRTGGLYLVSDWEEVPTG